MWFYNSDYEINALETKNEYTAMLKEKKSVSTEFM